MPSDDAKRAIEVVFRMEAPRLLGGLVRVVKDIGLAEDLAQEALIAALEKWPETGVPANPGAWLMTAAKNRAIDAVRRQRMVERKHDALARDETFTGPAVVEADNALGAAEGGDAEVGDDLLRLILIACHPILATEARVALTLRLLGGLTTDEIARAFLVKEPTIAQRIVRAKRTLADAKVPFEVPSGAALTARVPSVLEVLYLIFNEGYSASAGDEWMRVELLEDALRLARILAGLVPNEAEVHGLVALMELQASRMRARVSATGEPILLLDQDRSRWDHLLIRRGLSALERAEGLARPLGPYTLQAAIAACHARATVASNTDWTKIVALYDALVVVTGSPVVELNRAVAVSMAYGPDEALPLIDALVDEPAMRSYHLLPSVRGDLLMKLGRVDEARAEFTRAASLTDNLREKALLLARAARQDAPLKN